MKALVYTDTERIEWRDVAEPVPGPGQCVVEVAYSCICGSDMHAYHGQDSRRVPPLVLGHEAVGTVAGGRLAGKRVVINPLMTCGTCAACRGGREHLCANRELIGMRVAGAFAERVAVDEACLTELPDDLAFDQAAITEPLACAIHTVDIGLARLAGPMDKAKAVVLGGGAIGLLSALVFARRGIGELWIAETNPHRQAILRETVKARVYTPGSDDPDGTPPEEAVDIVLDAVGSGATRAAASRLAAPGGTIVHIGLQNQQDGLDTRRLTLQEIAFIGTYCYTRADFAEAVGMLSDGLIRRDGWTEVRRLADGAGGFADIDSGKAPPKILLKTGGTSGQD